MNSFWQVNKIILASKWFQVNKIILASKWFIDIKNGFIDIKNQNIVVFEKIIMDYH
jgi:hypothetical protein